MVNCCSVEVWTYSLSLSALLSHSTTGDDECIQVWSIDDAKCEQVLQGLKWGQVTTLGWVYGDPDANKFLSICTRTSTGLVSLCPKAADRNVGGTHQMWLQISHLCDQWFLWKNQVTSSVFDSNNAVEAQAYDPVNYRLAVASQSGCIKMFRIEGSDITRSR